MLKTYTKVSCPYVLLEPETGPDDYQSGDGIDETARHRGKWTHRWHHLIWRTVRTAEVNRGFDEERRVLCKSGVQPYSYFADYLAVGVLMNLIRADEIPDERFHPVAQIQTLLPADVVSPHIA